MPESERTMDKEEAEIEARLIDIIADHFKRPATQINDQTDFVKDLGVTITTVTTIFRLLPKIEMAFDISLHETTQGLLEDIPFKTVGDLKQIVLEKLKEENN